MTNDHTAEAQLMKVTSAWVVTFVASVWQHFVSLPWGTLAQFAAFLYSCSLIYEWLRKKFRKSDGTN